VQRGRGGSAGVSNSEIGEGVCLLIAWGERRWWSVLGLKRRVCQCRGTGTVVARKHTLSVRSSTMLLRGPGRLGV